MPYSCCINCMRSADTDGMDKCPTCGAWLHTDCGPCIACAEEQALTGKWEDGSSAVMSVARQDTPAQEQAATRPTRCTCDPLEADHVFRDSKSWPDNGDIETTWSCVVCGAEWTETKPSSQAAREYADQNAANESLFI